MTKAERDEAVAYFEKQWAKAVSSRRSSQSTLMKSFHQEILVMSERALTALKQIEVSDG